MPVNAAPPRHRRVADPAVLGVVSLGGVLGAEARYTVSLWLPHGPAQLAVGTWLVNTSGCFLIGVLMVLIARRFPGQSLIRPFVGVGILGGYTTFSTSVVDVQQAAAHGAPGTALLYLAATLVGALVAVWAGTALTELVVRER